MTGGPPGKPTDDPHAGGVNPLGGRIHHPVDDQERRRWAGFVAYVRTCPNCGWENDEHALFCVSCAEDLRNVPVTPSSDPRPGTVILQKRLARDRRQSGRLRLGETRGGGGWIAIGIALIVGTIVVNPERILAIPIWLVAVSLAVFGIWQLRIDTRALQMWGTIFAAISVLILGLVGYQAIEASSLIDDNGHPDSTPVATEGVTTSPALATPAAGSVAGVVPMAQGGASHDGVMPGPPPAGTPRLAWQADTGGELYAAPSLSGGLLFVSSKNGQILAVNAATGEIAWSSELSTYVTRGTPAIADGVVFAGGGFDFRAFDAATGKVLWQVPVQYGGQASPTIAGDFVLVTSQQGWLYALRRDTGETAWRIPTEGLAFGSVAVMDDNVIFGTDEGIVYNAKLDTGRLNWRTMVTGAVFATPALSGNTVFVTTASGEVNALDVETGQQRWTANHGSTNSLAISGDLVVVAASDGGVYGLDAATGTQRWLHPAGSNHLTAPVIVDNLVVIGAGSTLLALDTATGEAVWYFLAGDIIESPPVVVDGYVFFGGRDGFLYAVSVPA
jgi:outer membrane protein assembly factor BamB